MTELPPPPPAPPATLPPFTRSLLLCLAVFAAFLAMGAPVQRLNVAFGVWFTEVVVFLGVVVALLRAVGVDPVRTSGLDSTTPTAVALGFGLGLVNYAAWALPLMAVAQLVFPPAMLEAADAGLLFQHQTPLEQGLFVAGVCLAAPFCEELFFRGALQPGLMHRLPAPRAVVLTALIFSAFHFDPVGLVPRFELGVLFGLLAWRSGSVWPGIAAHAANNAVAAALYELDPGAEGGALPVSWVLGLFVAGNALLLGLARLSVGRLRSPRPAEDTAVPPVPLWKGTLWVGVPATAALLLFLALDWRGAMLRTLEAAHPLAPHVALPPELEVLRARARRGEVPVDEYLEARSLLGPGDAPGRPHRGAQDTKE